MPGPILTTKLYIPPAPSKIVLRPRLVERLNENLASGRRLTLVSASAGFGKTTLLSEWIAALTSYPSLLGRGEGVRAAWLSLDEGDSDPQRLLSYLVAAVQTLQPSLGEYLLAALQTPQPPPIEILLTNLINEIAALSDHFILVLDDYHTLDSQAVDAALTFLLDHLPPQLHLVIASREDPPLPLARLRAGGQLTELRAADLRFTPAEAAEFLNRVMGLDLSNGDVTALEARTEGWIAGLQLAAIALQSPLGMQGEKDVASFIRSFTGSHHYVLDYLLEEVLSQQPRDIQGFLLRTSILNRLCVSLCEAVLGEPAPFGQNILETLERANLFIVPLDNVRRWYRYHHLFGDLLRQRLASLPPSALSRWEEPQGGLHLRASAWYEANDDLAEAFHHAITAGDVERAARLAEAAWPGMEESFQSAAWLGWVKQLPETAIRPRPALCFYIGRAFSDAGEPETSEFHLRNAERALAQVSDQAELAILPGSIALTRAYNAQVLGKLTETVQYAELALQLIPEEDVYRRSQAAITLEFTHWASGNLEASLRAIHAWMADMHKLGNPVFVIASAFAEADLLVVLGRLLDAIAAYQQALHLAAESGPEAQAITAHHHLGLALIAHEMGDNESAVASLQTAAELGQRTTLVDWQHRWNLAQARFKESAGEFDAALELLAEARRVYVKNPVPITRPVEALRARVELKLGRLDKVQQWARQRGISTADEASYLAEYELLTLARLRLAEGALAGVNQLLERLLALADAQKRMGSVLEILLTQALVHQAQGNRPQAHAALHRSLALAEPEGYLRTFVDEGEPMHLLIVDLRWVIEKQAYHPLLAYIDKLLALFPQSAVAGQSAIRKQPSEMLDPLSERELEVLRLIAQGLSNAEIGQRFFLALSTVKGHNLRIFAKLQVRNRTEAVARARELGLI